MRCISAVLLTMMLLSSAVALITDISSVDGDYIDEGDFSYLITGPDTATVVDYCNDTDHIVDIPSVIPLTSYKVTAIDASFYYDCIETIRIPEFVESIESYCFFAENLTSFEVDAGNTHFSVDATGALFNYNKSKLIRYPSGIDEPEYTLPNTVVEVEPYSFEESKVHKVIIDDNLVIIGNGAFYNTLSMTSIVIPESSSLTMIGNNAFCNSAITTIELPWSLTFIGPYAFQNTKLSTVRIPDNLEYIGDGAFSDCSLLTAFTSDSSSYSVEDGVLFHTNNNVKTLVAYPCGKEANKYTIPADVVSIGPYAFDGTEKLEEVILNDRLTFIPESSFYNCTSLKTIDLSNVTVINNMAFDSCTNLTGVVFSDSLTYIGYASFYETGIEIIDIPASVTFVGTGAFGYCENLKEITFAESCKATVAAGIFGGSTNLTKITIYSRDVKLEDYSLSVGTSEEHTATIDLLVPSGYTLPKDVVGNDFTILNVSYIGERPYPWVNIIGAIVCALGIIGILYGMRQV